MPHLGKQIYRQTQHRLLNFCCLLSTDADDQRRQESISRKNSTTLQGAAEREPFDQSGGWGEFPQQAAGEISGDGNLPCSSSLYKRRHCLPSVTSQMRLLISWSSSLDGQTGFQSTIRNFTSNLLHIKKALGFGASWSSSLHPITPSKAAKHWNTYVFSCA